MEAVEYLMVSVAADLILVVYKAGVDILAFYEGRKYGALFIEHNGTQPLQLRLLLSVYIYLIFIFQFFLI